MSDASVDLSKMKVADLKKELKARGLSVDGKKNELQERLAEALEADGSVLEGPDGDGEADVDEEELLGEDAGGEVDESTEKELLGQAAKRPAPPVDVISPNKKVCKLAKPAEEEAAVDSDKPEEEKTPQEKRAERFGIPASDLAKKSARAERFGIVEKVKEQKGNKRAPKLDMTTGSTDLEKLKARAERFGEVNSKTLKKVSELEKKKERAERFKNGEAEPQTNGKEEPEAAVTDSKAEELKKKRAERFAAK